MFCALCSHHCWVLYQGSSSRVDQIFCNRLGFGQLLIFAICESATNKPCIQSSRVESKSRSTTAATIRSQKFDTLLSKFRFPHPGLPTDFLGGRSGTCKSSANTRAGLHCSKICCYLVGLVELGRRPHTMLVNREVFINDPHGSSNAIAS